MELKGGRGGGYQKREKDTILRKKRKEGRREGRKRESEKI